MMDIKVNIDGARLSPDMIKSKKADADGALDRLWSDGEAMTDWVKAPMHQDKKELEHLLNVADLVKQEAQLMVVIGIGGSYMGAKAAIEALPKFEDGIDVKFAGINFCSAYHRKLMDEMSRKETVLCVVSKSGNTLEVKVAFDLLKNLMEKKYGSKRAAARKIIAITDPENGSLRQEAAEEGYISFEIPPNTGGRFSAMTPAGLFPMAVAGIDIQYMLDGARAMAASPDWDQTGTDYAIARYLLMQQGKQIEALEFYDQRLTYLGEWVKQLYGESEGKNGTGLFPVNLNFSTDLHSMGQFLQEGSPVFFETVIMVDAYDDEIVIPQGTMQGTTLESLNRAAAKGVIAAHREAGTPVVEIHIPKLDAFYYGQLLYFFQTTCSVTAMMMGVDPFNQPGVEKYKTEMRKELDKKVL